MSKAIRTAVVTGGHGYDVRNFHKLFRSLHSTKPTNPYAEQMRNFIASARGEMPGAISSTAATGG